MANAGKNIKLIIQLELEGMAIFQKLRKKRLCRQYLAFPLLLLLLSFLMFLDPSLGKYLWLNRQKDLVKKEVAEKIQKGLEREKLVLFKVGLGEVKTRFRWLSSHEFEFDDKLYDVVESAVSEETVFLWCWPDDEEARLEKEINQMISRSLGQKGTAGVKQDERSPAPKNWPFLLLPGRQRSQLKLLSFVCPRAFPNYFGLSPQPPTPPPRLTGIRLVFPA